MIASEVFDKYANIEMTLGEVFDEDSRDSTTDVEIFDKTHLY